MNPTIHNNFLSKFCSELFFLLTYHPRASTRSLHCNHSADDEFNRLYTVVYGASWRHTFEGKYRTRHPRSCLPTGASKQVQLRSTRAVTRCNTDLSGVRFIFY